ncbi:MAG: aspartyl protease family protein [Halieaceae bacterium]
MLRWFAAMVLLGCSLSTLAVEVIVEALLPGIAVVLIDGDRVTLRLGQEDRGVLLLEADARSALIEVDGQRRRLGVSQRISGQFSQPTDRRVDVPRNDQLQYLTTAEINGRRMPVIIDTGANIVAMNAQQALAAGIAVDEGVRSSVQTAGSIVSARRVLLDRVSVGGISVDGVVASVLDGEYPTVVLLGMSYLQHVDLEERGGILSLRARW